jgi:tRNA(fMet)-specific endonuclease VapC
MTYALDTNIISYCIRRQYGIAEKIRQVLKEQTPIIISPITFYETLRGLYAVNAARRIEIFNNLCQNLTQKELDHEDWLEASRLYADMVQQGHPMSDSDLIQAAFCLRNGYTLVTHNTKHFIHVSALSMEDWAK